MKRLQLAHLPLRTKLIAASALTASIALLIAALTQGVSSYFYSHSEAYEHLHSVARVIAAAARARHSQPGLRPVGSPGQRAARRAERRRGDADRHREARAHALRGQPHDADAHQSASRTNIQKWQKQAIESGAHQHRFDGLTALHLVYPITDDGKLIGHLYVRANLSELQEAIIVQLAILLGSSVVAFALAYLLARRVQRQIAAPLLHLVDVMQDAERGDYSQPRAGHQRRRNRLT